MACLNNNPNETSLNSDTVSCNNVLQSLSTADLERLETVFKSHEDIGLTQHEFTEAIKQLTINNDGFGLWRDICGNSGQEKMTWNDFLDFCLKEMYPECQLPLSLNLRSIEPVPHSKAELVTKIVLIETDHYFCYALILKHGRIGLYDGNLNFLTSYHTIMTREDITRPEDERRRRNRWITDALFCPDTLLFIITNTTRSIMIYEASALNHVPYWLILSTPNILECLAYKPFEDPSEENRCSVLFAGDSNGCVMSFTFLQPKAGLLRRKRSDDVSLFYWEDFLQETSHVLVKCYGKVHKESVRRIDYLENERLLVSCSKDPNASIVLKRTDNKKKTEYFNVPKGINCFAYHKHTKTLITGSDSGLIKLWNLFIFKPIAQFLDHLAPVVDIQVIQLQNVFLSCSSDAIVKLWDLKESTCIQTIKLKFPSFRIHGKLIEWGVNCIYPGPKRRRPDESAKVKDKTQCFGIEDVNEISPEVLRDTKKENVWERSCVLVTCCNYLALLRTNFPKASIEFEFTYPVLPAPPLQNCVLIPASWGLKSETALREKLDTQRKPNVSMALKDFDFILRKNILDDFEKKSDINFKIAVLEAKKEKVKMRSIVALGSAYLALDLHDIPDLSLSENLPLQTGKTYMQKIKKVLENAARKDEIFLSPPISGSRSNKSSLVELPY